MCLNKFWWLLSSGTGAEFPEWTLGVRVGEEGKSYEAYVVYVRAGGNRRVGVFGIGKSADDGRDVRGF